MTLLERFALRERQDSYSIFTTNVASYQEAVNPHAFLVPNPFLLSFPSIPYIGMLRSGFLLCSVTSRSLEHEAVSHTYKIDFSF